MITSTLAILVKGCTCWLDVDQTNGDMQFLAAFLWIAELLLHQQELEGLASNSHLPPTQPGGMTARTSILLQAGILIVSSSTTHTYDSFSKFFNGHIFFSSCTDAL